MIDVNRTSAREGETPPRQFVAAIKSSPAPCCDINDSQIVKKTNSFSEDVDTLMSLGRIYKPTRAVTRQADRRPIKKEPRATVATVQQAGPRAKNDPKFGHHDSSTRRRSRGPVLRDAAPSSIHHTMGGLTINSRLRVLDTRRHVIPEALCCGRSDGRYPRLQPSGRQRHG